ncbi:MULTISPECIES: BON domain-containing protein [Burkholderiales]|uniref:Transporter n=1 Tax=Burkholderia cepacia TaxID=292 RepID=A0AAQ0F4B1_BURCE|nr:BON domain-containing protein [Burkholderia cepacia]MBY4714910.1 BON domain-containing protein [Burkholderia cepacia]MBY4739017.1 BON domain-containing protein [Burkholderia cepacia]MBY4744062.1 BON domain-containing protein [Burkholderia cepacia]MBY4757047.1 BON domain-containing protein [Burkholderia cepacia]MBY4777069.1 BON domain-containing protein [Burkholderia cepacia]
MKSIQVRALAIAALILAASGHAWSQPGQAASAPVGMPAASASTAESVAAPAGTRKANRALRRKVYAAIGKYKKISAGNVSVVVRGGAVTLSGTVTDAAQVNEVAQIAKGVQGVTSVTNKLTVQKPFDGS